MPSLQEQIKQDLAVAIKSRDEKTKSALRVILGELNRQGNKTVKDEEVIRIVKKLIKAEQEVIHQTGDTDSSFIAVAQKYLPKMADSAEIKTWIAANIDFSKYKNKMQAMGEIMRYFGARADGNVVKSILREF